MTASRPRLLLIDDEPALSRFLADAAGLSGFDPVIAQDHRDFRNKFRAELPDMVAIDLGMPGMDGIELLRFLADERATQPIMIISGFDNRIIDTAFRLGEALGLTMVGPVTKPARLDALETIFHQVRERLAA